MVQNYSCAASVRFLRKGPVHLNYRVDNLAPTEQPCPVGVLPRTRWREPSFWTIWVSSNKSDRANACNLPQAHGPHRDAPFRATAAVMMRSGERGSASASAGISPGTGIRFLSHRSSVPPQDTSPKQGRRPAPATREMQQCVALMFRQRPGNMFDSFSVERLLFCTAKRTVFTGGRGHAERLGRCSVSRRQRDAGTRNICGRFEGLQCATRTVRGSSR
jgi:hypothetical protein